MTEEFLQKLREIQGSGRMKGFIESIIGLRQDKKISGKFSDYLVLYEACRKQVGDFFIKASTPSLIIFLTHYI